jgi:GT2 family glycosyltransferase
MKFSIIIPTAFDHLESDLKPCIESIIKYTDLTDVEVIVVANGCTDDTANYVLGLANKYNSNLGQPAGPPAKFILLQYPVALGYAKACNKGLEIAKGDYAILLNNDTYLLPQEQNAWLKQIESPFLSDPKVGVSGPLARWSEETKHNFLIFFIAAIKRELYLKLKLNEEYGVGGGEDTEYCIEAEKLGYKVTACDVIHGVNDADKVMLGTFPIYHKGEATMNKLPNWKELYDANTLKLSKKYNPEFAREQLHNNYERAVIDNSEDMSKFPREKARYDFAAKHLTGKKILEFGCSSGYGLRMLPKDIDYTGVDYDEKIIEFAMANFANPNRKFVHADIHNYPITDHYSTIIAFEVIEHLDDGKEIAQMLKKHCDTLLITTPYKEPVGFWGEHHKIHGLSQKDFPGFEYSFMYEDGTVHDVPNPHNPINLMLMRWEKGKTYDIPVEEPTVMAFVPTKDRYDSLPLTLQALALQTRPPDKIVIFDDGEHKDIREEVTYKHLFKLFELKNIQWSVVFGNKQGQHFGHQYANTCTDFTYIWRVDDDEVPEPNVLASLLAHMTAPGGHKVGAVAGAVVTPGQDQRGGTNKIEDLFDTPNLQWAIGKEVREVEHLYSSFLYRPGIAKYNLELSPAAHREETLFSNALFKSGYKLIVDTSIVTWHFRQEKGGIRSSHPPFFFENDERVFFRNLEADGIKVISLDAGLGDHFAFLNIVPDLLKKYKKLILGVCYPDVFTGIKGIKLVSVGSTNGLIKENVYKWMTENNWKTSIVDAYRKMYL